MKLGPVKIVITLGLLVVAHAVLPAQRTARQPAPRSAAPAAPRVERPTPFRVGETLTYGQLAKLAGSPHAARAVGGAMARNRWPLIVPCHRVVGSSGKLTGYSGEGGLKTKHWLLEHEFHAAHGNLFLTSAQ